MLPFVTKDQYLNNVEVIASINGYPSPRTHLIDTIRHLEFVLRNKREALPGKLCTVAGVILKRPCEEEMNATWQIAMPYGYIFAVSFLSLCTGLGFLLFDKNPYRSKRNA
jgi:hypothetical protein